MTVLAVDAGNTTVTAGLFRGGRLVAQTRVPTDLKRSAPELVRWVKTKAARTGRPEVVISSVVPRMTPALVLGLQPIASGNPAVVGRQLPVPLTNRYRVPSQVGADRLVNAWAADRLYGAPAIIVDFGTAVTIDILSKRREYLGGLIIPGLELAVTALTDKAALLPAISLKGPVELLGRDTTRSIRSGGILGYAALCDGLVRKLKARHAQGARVIATGGQAGWVLPYCRQVRIHRPDLTLQGLFLLKNA
ncbi:MAG: pantothenate kinase [Candidatus Omnitrophica bacterium CG11_big_fil_rev_8_21_14_0_20_64_10]|nr:MAG: pantothenate kinase [Candidatus Omnitrophica bacterium CG11_big_fil_rev_8_21_14_0_20_64_10]